MMSFTRLDESRASDDSIASVLVEVLPYIQRFRNKTIVVKVGGSALVDANAADEFAADIALLHLIGINPVVVHGGGPQITQMMERLGKKASFRNGHRVTDMDSLDIARMVLVGNVNRELVSRINRHGSIALGVSGEDADLLVAIERDPELGFVGDVASVNPDLIHRLLAEGLVPVVATMGTDGDGQPLNINADSGASAIAAELGAHKLVYLTDVDGLYQDPNDRSTLIQKTTGVAIQGFIDSGMVGSGMIPKLEGCVSALTRGVPSAHIIGSGTPHALLVELFTDDGIGTLILPGERS